MFIYIKILIAHLNIYNSTFVKWPRDLGLNSTNNINYYAGHVYVYLCPVEQKIFIGTEEGRENLMLDFIETSQDAWGYNLKNLKKINDYTYEIVYNSKIINKYLT